MARFAGALVVVLFLVACGGGGSSFTPRPAPKIPTPVALVPEAQQAPIIPHYRLQEQGIDFRFIGTALEWPTQDVSTTTHEGTAVTYERVPADPSVAPYVWQSIAQLAAKRNFSSPPIVRMRDHGPVFKDLVVRTVQLLNDALPNDFQLRVDATPYTSSVGVAPEGIIRVEMLPRNEWSRTWIPFTYRPDASGLAALNNEWAQVFVDTEYMQAQDDEGRIRLLAHEFIHALAASGEHYPQNRQEESLMVPDVPSDPQSASALTILFPVDIMLLRALYDPASLGSWNTESYQVQACMDDVVCYGVTAPVGDADPWANNGGLQPSMDLADNPALSGTVTWRGRLLGLTSADEVVGGVAALGIDLATLDGDLGFTGLEYWRAGGAPGDVGSGFRWGDGDLTYGVEVSGSTFIQDGRGDAGIVTGIFAGVAHEYMTGVLERDDLAAGFGGKR